MQGPVRVVVLVHNGLVDCTDSHTATHRDTRWLSWTLSLGWPVAGIWPPNSDGTDVNAVDRAPKGGTFATGDDFGGVKLFRWPAPVTATAHCSALQQRDGLHRY